MDKARNRALKIINAVHEQSAYANVALAKELRKGELGDLDRRFVTELVYGTVKAGDTLDWIIRQYINRPMSKVEPIVRDILRMGVYQLRYMDKIPVSAVCNESVELAKQYGHVGLSKFVNGVLRTMVREPERGNFPEGKGKATTHLALTQQHPEWLVRRWIKEFGYEETDGQMAAIEDVKKDMESEGIMDRLICGDVGYGKTEVALRAAFKAVQ